MLEREDNWLKYFSYANEMAKLCRYDEALAYYEKCRQLREPPRFIDTEEAMAQIYEIKGDYPKAVAMQEAILDILKNDWNITEGGSVDSRLRAIERLNHRENAAK